MAALDRMPSVFLSGSAVGLVRRSRRRATRRVVDAGSRFPQRSLPAVGSRRRWSRRRRASAPFICARESCCRRRAARSRSNCHCSKSVSVVDSAMGTSGRVGSRSTTKSVRSAICFSRHLWCRQLDRTQPRDEQRVHVDVGESVASTGNRSGSVVRTQVVARHRTRRVVAARRAARVADSASAQRLRVPSCDARGRATRSLATLLTHVHWSAVSTPAHWASSASRSSG